MFPSAFNSSCHPSYNDRPNRLSRVGEIWMGGLFSNDVVTTEGNSHDITVRE